MCSVVEQDVACNRFAFKCQQPQSESGVVRWLELTMHAEDEWLHIPEGSTVRLALDYPAGRTGMHVFYEDESGMLHDTAAEYDASAGILTLDVPSGGRLFTVTGAESAVRTSVTMESHLPLRANLFM